MRRQGAQAVGPGIGRELRTLSGHSGSVNGVAVSGDEWLAFSASSDKSLKVWDLETGRELRTIAGHSDSVNGVAVSGDRRHAVSISSDNTLRLWDPKSGRELRTLPRHSDSVEGVAVSGDGSRAVSASHDGTPQVLDLETGGLLANFICDAAALSLPVAQSLPAMRRAGSTSSRSNVKRIAGRKDQRTFRS